MRYKLFVMTVMLITTVTVMGQGVKIGYTNIDAIVFNMPEVTTINLELDAYQNQLKNQVNSMKTEIDAKIQQLQAIMQTPNISQNVLQEREDEIRKMNNDLIVFSEEVEEKYSSKQAILLNPVYQKVQNAIDQVRKEQGYAMILNAQIPGAGGIVLAANDEDNITEAVFAKLGVPMPTPINTEE